MYEYFNISYPKRVEEQYLTELIGDGAYSYSNVSEFKEWLRILELNSYEPGRIDQLRQPDPVDFTFYIDKRYKYIPKLDIFYFETNLRASAQYVISRKLYNILKGFKIFGSQYWPVTIKSKAESSSEYFLLIILKDVSSYFLDLTKSYVTTIETNKKFDFDPDLSFFNNTNLLIDFNQEHAGGENMDGFFSFSKDILQYDMFVWKVFSFYQYTMIRKDLRGLFSDILELREPIILYKDEGLPRTNYSRSKVILSYNFK